MRLIGLTGGIATGKSTVSAMLRQLGAHVIDADEVAREVVEPPSPTLEAIAARFPGVVGADGRLDRKALGDRIFSDQAERSALNALIHPVIAQQVLERTRALAEQGVKLAIYDAPLLFENRLQEGLAGVILVDAPPEVQQARLMARNSLSAAEAAARIAAQLPMERKRQLATWIVDNGGAREATQAQVADVWRQVSLPG